MPKPKHFYTIHRCRSDYSSAFEHISVRVYGPEAAQSSSADEIFTLKWQGDRDNSGWYGFHVEFSADYPSQAIERMKVTQSLLKRLLDAKVLVDKPDAVIPALGIDRRVYDDRCSEYLALHKVLPEDYVRWMAW